MATTVAHSKPARARSGGLGARLRRAHWLSHVLIWLLLLLIFVPLLWMVSTSFKDRVELEELFRKGQCPWMVWDANRSDTARERAVRAQLAAAESPAS